MAQRTLLQLNFIPLSKVEVYSDESEQSIPNTDSSCSPGLSVMQTSVQGLNDLDRAENSWCESALSNDSAEILIGDHKSDMPSLSSENVAYCGKNVNVEALSGTVLETFIVGRKFSDQKELLSGTKVSLLREPDNPKDPNAVKVVLWQSF